MLGLLRNRIQSAHDPAASPNEDAPKHTSRLQTLNTHLASRTTILGSKPSVADIALFSYLTRLISSWDSSTRTGEQGYHHIVRHANFVQNSPLFGPLKLDEGDRVKIDEDDVVSKIKPVDMKAERERKKKEKEEAAKAGAGGTQSSAAPESGSAQKEKKTAKDKAKDKAEAIGGAAAATATVVVGGKKKEKKEKAPKQQPPKPAEKPVGPGMVDMRVGHILKAVQHPNADSLYVSTIACGDAPGTDNTDEFEGQVCRTVCSGLSGRVPLEVMNGARVVVIANLKPVTMRGVKSCAMVLCASERPAEGADPHGAKVELCEVPEGSGAGERVYVEGFGDGAGDEPEKQLNPKKKVWESVQPGFYTDSDLGVFWDVEKTALAGEGDGKRTGCGRLRTKDGQIKARTIAGASCS